MIASFSFLGETLLKTANKEAVYIAGLNYRRRKIYKQVIYTTRLS